jgi:hypothetical protein
LNLLNEDKKKRREKFMSQREEESEYTFMQKKIYKIKTKKNLGDYVT